MNKHSKKYVGALLHQTNKKSKYMEHFGPNLEGKKLRKLLPQNFRGRILIVDFIPETWDLFLSSSYFRGSLHYLD